MRKMRASGREVIKLHFNEIFASVPAICKRINLIVLIIVLILPITVNIFAYEIEEETDYIWLQEEITNASINSVSEPNLNSRYAIAIDRDSKAILFGKNENNRVPMASTTKIMTAIVLLENLGINNNLTLNTEIEICKQAASIGGSRLGLRTGDKITVNDLLYGLMLCSGNDAAIQIAVSIAGSVEEFANLMNKKAEELGLKDTHFVTPHGLDKEEHYTTAYELALIADYALNIEKIAEVVKNKNYTVSINSYSKTITNTNELLGYLDGVNGVKTGFTNGAGRCLVTSVERDGFNIITVVLGADTKKFRTKDSISLIEYAYSNYELINLEELINEKFEEWRKINEKRIYIYKGKKENIGIKLDEYKYKIYPVKKENIKDINIQIENINTYFEAPVNKGEKVVILNLNIGDKELMSIKTVTNENIERKKINDYILECLENII